MWEGGSEGKLFPSLYRHRLGAVSSIEAKVGAGGLRPLIHPFKVKE